MIYVFADCRLDIDRRELLRGSKLVRMEPQVFDLLSFLVRNRTRVVSKDELLAEVWNGRIVSESTIGSRIAAARQAIGDDGKAQGVIRTAPRKGLRFVVEVREILARDWREAAPVLPVEARNDTSPPPPSELPSAAAPDNDPDLRCAGSRIAL